MGPFAQLQGLIQESLDGSASGKKTLLVDFGPHELNWANERLCPSDHFGTPYLSYYFNI